MKRMTIALFMLSFLMQINAIGAELLTLLPQSNAVAGWEQDGDVVQYTAENLYEYIDGEAELYHAYDFQQLATVAYFKTSPEDSFMTVNVYDMGNPINAFGVYSNYRYPGYDFQTIGAEAMVSEYDIKFYQDRYFVDISLADESPVLQQGGVQIANAISNLIGTGKKEPALLALLPKTDQVEKTLRYVKTGMLNQAFLPGGIEAKYTVANNEVTGFLVMFDSPEQVDAGYKALIDFYLKDQDSPEPVDGLGEGGVALTSEYQGCVLLGTKGPYLYGAHHLAETNQGIPLAKAIAELLP